VKLLVARFGSRSTEPIGSETSRAALGGQRGCCPIWCTLHKRKRPHRDAMRPLLILAEVCLRGGRTNASTLRELTR